MNNERPLVVIADASIDWPARFRAAADAVEARRGWKVAGVYSLRDLANWYECQPPDEVEAIRRALNGEDPT